MKYCVLFLLTCCQITSVLFAEIITVPSGSSSGVQTSYGFVYMHVYEFKITGTYYYNDAGGIADGYWMQYKIGDGAWNNCCSSYSPDHIYYFALFGAGKPISFRISDLSDWYQDNAGSLKVQFDGPILVANKPNGGATNLVSEPNQPSPSTNGNQQATGSTDPVYLNTGELYYVAKGPSIKGQAMDVDIIRTYRSKSEYYSRYGYGWDMNYNLRLRRIVGGQQYILLNGKNNTETYWADAAYPGKYFNDSLPGEYLQINENGDGVLYKKGGTCYVFNANGCISQIIDRYGNMLSFEYEQDDDLNDILKPIYYQEGYWVPARIMAQDYQLEAINLITASGKVERTIKFFYHGDVLYTYTFQHGKLGQIQDTANSATTTDDRSWYYYYLSCRDCDNANNPLQSVMQPSATVDIDGTLTTVGLKTYYAYSKRLTKIYDPANTLGGVCTIPYLEITYDDSTKVWSQTYGEGNGIHGDGIGEYVLEYTDSTTTRVTDRMGVAADNVFDSKGREIRRIIHTPSEPADRLRYEGVDSEYNDPAQYQTPEYAYTAIATDGVEGMIKSVTYPLGNRVEYTYYTNASYDKDSPVYGLVHTQTEYPIPGTEDDQPLMTTYSYEPTYGFVESVTDNHGNEIEFEYSSDARNLMQIKYPSVPVASETTNGVVQETLSQSQIDFTYYTTAGQTTFGKVKTVQSIGGPVIEYTYYPDTASVGSIGRVWKVEVDPTHQFHPANEEIITTYEYDVYGNVKKITHPDGGYKQFQFNKLDQLVELTSELGYKTQFWYNPNKKLSKVLSQVGSTFDAANCKITSFTYDLLNSLKTVEDSIGRVTTCNYNYNDEVSTVVDAQESLETGSNTEDVQYVYDERGLIWTITDAHNNVTKHWYDANGNLIRIRSNANGQVADYQETTYDYDGYGRLIQKTYPLGEDEVTNTTETFRYDNLGNVVSKTTRHGDTTYYKHDALGRVLSEALDSSSGVITIDDGDTGTASTGTWNGAADAAMQNGDYVYTSQSGATYTYQLASSLAGYYSILLQWPSVTGASNNVSVAVYENGILKNDVLNPAASSADVFTINQQIDAGQWNQLSTFRFDGAGVIRVVITANDASYTLADAVKAIPAVRYMYDQTGGLFQVIRAEEEIANRYDNFGRLAQTTDPFGRTVSYGYDNFSRWMEVYYPDHVDGVNDSFVVYAADAMGRITDVYYNGDEYPIAHYAYDALSSRTLVEYDFDRDGTSDATSEYDYEDKISGNNDNFGDNLKQIINKIGATDISSFAYTWDNVGNRRTITSPYDASTYASYTYDDIYRLNSRSGGGLSLCDYYYDALGNRTSATFGGSAYTYYINNGLNQYDLLNNSIELTYDNNGNLTYDGTYTCQYDAENWLTDVYSNITPVAHYAYDVFGRRISKTVYSPATKTTQYVYNGADLIAEYENGVLARKYIYGPGLDELICMIDSAGNAYYYYYDGLGSVTALSYNGTVVERYKYDPFGITTVCDGSGNPLTSNESAYGNRFMFTGREFDAETGLYYYRMRMYEPQLGRFMQPDPIGYADGMNIYAYCSNNPVNFVDPWGNFASNDFMHSSGGPDPFDGIGPINEYRDYMARGGGGVRGRVSGPTVDPITGQRVGRFIVDPKGNTMIEPAGGGTRAWPKEGGLDTQTYYPNGSNYQRLDFSHGEPHGHGHLEGPGGPGRIGQGPSLDPSGRVVPSNSPDAHWPINLGLIPLIPLSPDAFSSGTVKNKVDQ